MDLRREGAVVADETRGTPADLRAVWASLVDGRCKIADSFSARGRSYLVLESALSTELRPLAVELRVTFEGVVAHGSLKIVASELGYTISTIAMRAKAALAFIGLGCPFSRAPTLIILAVHAAHGANLLADVRESELHGPEGTFRVLSTANLGLSVANRLSPGENAVVGEWLEGRSHAEVALVRRTSSRTVANQISTASRKLGVSGRLDFIRRLAIARLATSPVRISA